MSSDPPSEKSNYIYLKPEEIQKFRTNADEDLYKIKEFFSDYFHGTIDFSDEIFSFFFELFATTITLKNFLDKVFIFPEEEPAGKDVAFKVGSQHILILGKTLLYLKETKKQLALSGFSMQNQ